MVAEPTAITALIERWRSGEPAALDSLLPQVYADLRQLAASQLKRQGGHPTLQPTALVHEVFVRLLGAPAIQIGNRKHFFATAAKLMGQVLVDRARAAARDKRGGDWQRVEFTAALGLPLEPDAELLALAEAIAALGLEDPDLAELVQLRYFVGLEVSEIASLWERDERTIYRDWAFARAWLRERLALDA